MQISRQKGDGLQAWLQIILRHQMRLIKNQNTVRHIVHLPQFSPFVRIHRLKKLHRSGNDKRRVPVFHGCLCRLPIIFRNIFCILIRKGRLMAQNLHIVTKQLSENLRCLLNDTVIRDHINNPLFLPGNGSLQSNHHTGQRFAASRRHIHEINLSIFPRPDKSLLLQK